MRERVCVCRSARSAQRTGDHSARQSRGEISQQLFRGNEPFAVPQARHAIGFVADVQRLEELRDCAQWHRTAASGAQCLSRRPVVVKVALRLQGVDVGVGDADAEVGGGLNDSLRTPNRISQPFISHDKNNNGEGRRRKERFKTGTTELSFSSLLFPSSSLPLLFSLSFLFASPSVSS